MLRHREIPSFVYDPSCVFYANLAKHDGASFMSDDAYGHLCTVTGATWGLQDRTFDGVDDRIAAATSPAFTVTEAITLIGWVKPFETVATKTALIHSLEDVSGAGGIINLNETTGWVATAGAAVCAVYTTAGWKTIGATGVLTADVWVHLAMTYDRVTLILYQNGLSKATSAQTAAIASNAPRPVSIFSSGTPDTYAKGDGGEFWMYNRALFPLEIQQNYLGTRWRYQ